MAKFTGVSFGPMVRSHVTAEAYDEGNPLGGRDQAERLVSYYLFKVFPHNLTLPTRPQLLKSTTS